MNLRASSIYAQIPLIILYLIPPLATAWFILDYGVDVPYHDQWILPSLFENFKSGTLQFIDLFNLHNYHRLIFPKLIFLGLGLTSNWNIYAELICSFSLAILTFLGLYQLSRLTNPEQQDNLFHLTNLLTSLVFFSWIQYQNWLWGFQVAIFLINFCTISACLILSYPKFLSTKWQYIGSAILCGIASFSSAQGLASWLALIPCVLGLEGSLTQRRKRLLVWILLFLISVYLYFLGYQPDEALKNDAFKNNPDLAQNPSLFLIHFLFNIIASPLIGSLQWSWVLGLIILWYFFYLLYELLIKNHHLYSFTFPWISIGLFGLLSSVLIAKGRYYLGADYGILQSSRFTTHTLLLLVAIFQLSLIWVRFKISALELLKNQGINTVLTYGVLVGILGSLTILRGEYAVIQATDLSFFLKSGQTCLTLIDYLEDSPFLNTSVDSCLVRIYPDVAFLRQEVKRLKTLQLRTFAETIPFVSDPNLKYGYLHPLPNNEPLVIRRKMPMSLSGWAILPDSQQQPNLIFLSYNNQKSFFANAYITVARPDIAELLKSKSYTRAGWQVVFSGESLPVGENKIKAWVYDPKRQQFIQLNGENSVTVKPKKKP
ncbi:hypothetical protein [Planktothrix mougeotii]|uniref:YfhO family protein n=1 Tax=Planktothrix mougeotii LEGE 06226 TaxID=1828728 RepID=A0ABR9U7I5_9CYAN|nr:hypothetical protein [Planktothrix mougeotii]MBE9142420.1 hypothetical protein [Planktothrix mougeotii LEGE 06226]